MKKVLFAGPSIYGAKIDLGSIELKPPAAQGDLTKAVLAGASVIGLVDGVFEAVASVWHKEILYAIQQDVTVIGAASMGALRAAECAYFGMIPIGKIANSYLDGSLDDDAAVAILHGPHDMGCPPFTQALVDVEATISYMRSNKIINSKQAELVLENARNIFFKERTIEMIMANLPNADYLKKQYEKYFVNQKQNDAIELIEFMKGLSPQNIPKQVSWKLAQPRTWMVALSDIMNERAAAK